jgi:hypothetical protein
MVRITFAALPLRARSLDANQLSQVFGGCASQCEKPCDCCDGYKCTFGICSKL